LSPTSLRNNRASPNHPDEVIHVNEVKITASTTIPQVWVGTCKNSLEVSVEN